MANKIPLEIELKTQIKDFNNIKSNRNLSGRQERRYNRAQSKATHALENGDIANLKKNITKMIKVLEESFNGYDKISTKLEKIVKKYNQIIKEVDDIKTTSNKNTKNQTEKSTKTQELTPKSADSKKTEKPTTTTTLQKETTNTSNVVSTIQQGFKDTINEIDKLKNTPQLELTQQQEESYLTNKRGAEIALENNDLKNLRYYFNAMVETIKKASVASGNISQQWEKISDQVEELSKESNKLIEQRTALETTIIDNNGIKDIEKKTAEKLLATYKNKDKIITKAGAQLTTPEEINAAVKELDRLLKEAGKDWRSLTNEIAQKAGLKDNKAGYAARGFVKAERDYINQTEKDIADLNAQIDAKDDASDRLKDELENIDKTAPEAAQALQEVYAQLVKIKNTTNKTIDVEQSKQNKKKAGVGAGSTSDLTLSNNELKQQNSSLGKALKQFTLYKVALKAVKTAAKEAIATVKELDKELTEQAMVTGLTRKQTYNLVKSYQELALQTGATTKEIASVATEYMKQGKSIKESLVLTEAAVAAAKVARVSTADSVNYLTTALNGFQLASEDAMRISDKFAAVAAASATDYDELAIALSKVASQANLAGMSIDYTTALLTKGLETTREAPETMGTALKTIIARMRELGDYGETLEGDTDINNVEKQLAYVGIALRNTEGELRSTEDVLDELGKKWNTLNKNQQAAVAKALAGTRQQSRLIALMTDYERVTELQEIAQRSAGATAAQAGVYLEGMEASLNKITVAWEKIVMAVSDSELIINTFSFVGDSLNFIGEFLSTDWGLVATLTTVLTLVTQGLTAKIQEQIYAKEQQKIEKENLKIRLEERKAQIELLKEEYKQTKEEAEQAASAEKKAKVAAAEVILSKKNITAAQRQAALAEIAAAEAEYTSKENKIKLEYTTKMNDLKIEELSIESQLNTLAVSQERLGWNIASATTMAAGAAGGMLTKSTGLLVVFSALSGILQLIPTFINLATIAQKKQNKETKKGAIYSVAGGLAKIWPWGPIAAVAALAIVGIAIAIKNTRSESDKTAEEINKLSNEIYKLTEKANGINKAISSFEKLDNKIIKTKKDMEDMNSLLEQAADSLSDEADSYAPGVTEQQHYASLATQEQRLDFLKTVRDEAEIKARESRVKQIDLFKGNSELLDEKTTDTSVRKAQSALRANVNSWLYDYIDEITEDPENNLTESTLSAVEELVANMLGTLSLSDALEYNQNTERINNLVDSVKSLTTEVKDLAGVTKNISLAEVLTSDDYGITEKTQAYIELKDSLGSTSDAFILLENAYSQFSVFSEMSEDTLRMIDKLEISIDKINDLNDAWSMLAQQGLTATQEEYKKLITDTNGLLDTLAQTGGDVAETINTVFGQYLNTMEDSTKVYSALVNTISNLIGHGMLNIGQNVTKLKNIVNSFYEKASEWNTLSDSEKMDFMNDNAELFKGANGAKLLKALETNDWNTIQQILSESEEIQKQIDKELTRINTELSIEQAKNQEERNEAYINSLLQMKKDLEDQTNFFRADLELLIKQEEQQLDIYKDYLKKQQDQLEESLEERKKAYQDYFDAINQQLDDEDYYDKSNLLIENITKLASSTDTASQKQQKELEQQLEELEKERQKELRQRAQEATIESIENEVESISKKFDTLLNNEQLLLEAMQTEANNNSYDFISGLISSAKQEGMTNLQLESYTQDLISAFGALMSNIDIQEISESIQNNAVINVGNNTIDLNNEDGYTLWSVLMTIMKNYGYR